MAFSEIFYHLILFIPAFCAFGQNFNRPVPNYIPPYEFVLYDTSYHGYYLTAPFRLGAGNQTPVPAMILDSKGYLVWYMLSDALNLLDFKYSPEHELYSFIKFKTPDNVRFTLMDTGFQLVDSFTTVNGFAPDPHDFQITAGETYLVTGISDSIMDLSAYLFNGMPGSLIPMPSGS